jgi:glycosyltransferase involved in cell wall biosynthesis
MKYSIILPNYNSEKYIKRCIDSVLNQTYKNFELIIIDDMSTDNSPDIIREYCSDTRVKFIELSQKRYNGGTRNVGIDLASGDYILFLDCDDYVYSNKALEELNNFIMQNKTDLVRVSYVACKNGGTGKVRLREQTLQEMSHTVFVAPWTKVIKREKVVKFPENTLLEDVSQHIEQIDKLETMSNSNIVWSVWNRDNENAISADKAKYDRTSKRYTSVYRVVADLIDLQLTHQYCKEERDKRVNAYIDIIRKDDILNLVNGGESQ